MNCKGAAYMSMNINSVLNNSSNQTPGAQSSTNSTTTDFMQLLVAELQNQDPTDAMNSSDMLNQLSELNTLQELTQMAQSEQTLQSTVNDMFAHQCLGSTVTVQDTKGSQVTGTVSSITYNNGSPNLVINNTSYPLSSLVSE